MIRIEIVKWQDKEALIRSIREAVFIGEQNVPVELEWDGLDKQCTQLLAFSGDEVVGTARMTVEGKIGRMAVLKPWRGLGVGSELLKTVIATAREASLSKVELDAQVYAIPFYQRFGFEMVSDLFMDAGIEHRKMVLALA